MAPRIGTKRSRRSSSAPPLEAVSWLQEAARLGSADAQYELANAYADGRGVPRDPINAYACYVLAGANGNFTSEEALRFLTPTLTDARLPRCA